METQKSVAEWRESVFGRSALPHRILGRCLEEFAELVGMVGFPYHEARLRGAAEDMKAAELGADVSPEFVKRAIGDEAADVLVVLMGFCHEVGVDLQAELDRKMAVNRKRKWKVTAAGLGQHETAADGRADGGV